MKIAEKTLYKNTKTFEKNFCNKLADKNILNFYGRVLHNLREYLLSLNSNIPLFIVFLRRGKTPVLVSLENRNIENKTLFHLVNL